LQLLPLTSRALSAAMFLFPGAEQLHCSGRLWTRIPLASTSPLSRRPDQQLQFPFGRRARFRLQNEQTSLGGQSIGALWGSSSLGALFEGHPGGLGVGPRGCAGGSKVSDAPFTLEPPMNPTRKGGAQGVSKVKDASFTLEPPARPRASTPRPPG
jgi:hypothetical protein